MSAVPPITATDRECLEAFLRRPEAESLRPVIERYLAFVYSSALRRTGDAAQAAEVARAVFLVFARRARKLRKKTVLAAWLFHITALACQKAGLKRSRGWRWFRRNALSEPLDETPLWTRVAPEMDRAIDQLPTAQRNAVLLCNILNHDSDSAAKILHTRDRRVKKHAVGGMKKIAKHLRELNVNVTVDTLMLACATEGCAAPVPPGLGLDLLKLVEGDLRKRPSLSLARRTLNTLAWKRWRRRVAIGIPTFIAVLATLAGTAWYIDSLSGHSRLISAFLVWQVRKEGKTVPGLAVAAQRWPSEAVTQLNAASVRSARDLYQTTNIWLAHLKFSREQWKALEPERIGALPNFLQPDGTVLLRNPEAQRSGLAGVLGWDFNWTHADFEFGGMPFTNVGSRFKGNGTYLGSLYGWKRPFKVDLNKFAQGQKLGGVDELTFNNLITDQSCLSDALAYEFLRDAGVPAPRTAYAWLTVSVKDKWNRKPLGLYVMVEPVDEEFARERFGSKKAPVFKPVTYKLFEHLGDDWPAYAAIYDLKTKATPAQERRVIEFARLVSFASDAEFAERVGDFLDLDETARFIAGMVLLSSYDSIFANGQNFYAYLDPRSNKFGFIPWDLDLAWGNFFLLGTKKDREQASIWHPWVGENRFLERVMAVPEFRSIYRAHLEDFSTRLFVPSRLNQRIDELAAVIRSPVAAESEFRLDKFEQSIGNRPANRSRGSPMGADRPAHPLKRFIAKRSISVRDQLDGKSEGTVIQRSGR